MTTPSKPQDRLEPLELADTLRQQAELVLQEIRLAEIIQPYGPITRYLIHNRIQIG